MIADVTPNIENGEIHKSLQQRIGSSAFLFAAFGETIQLLIDFPMGIILNYRKL